MKSHIGCLLAGSALGYGAAHHLMIVGGVLAAAVTLLAAYSLALWLAMRADSRGEG